MLKFTFFFSNSVYIVYVWMNILVRHFSLLSHLPL